MSITEAKIDKLIAKYDNLYDLRRYKRKFIPIEEVAKNPALYGYNFPPRESKAKQREFLNSTYKVSAVIAANRCLGKDQLIYDPVKKTLTKVSEITGDHHVYAHDGKKRVVAKARQPFLKEESSDIYRVEFKNKQTIDVSPYHLVLDAFGTYRPVYQLLGGASVFLQESSLAHALRVPLLGVQRYCRKVLNSICDYFSYHRLYDEQLHYYSKFFRDSQPSQADAQGRSLGVVSSPLDDSFGKQEHNHLCRFAFHHSNLGGLLQDVDLFGTALFRIAYTKQRHVGSSNLIARIFLGLFSPLLLSIYAVFQLASFLMLPFSTSATINAYKKLDSKEIWDFDVPGYKNYMIGDTVHHNTGKTESGCVKFLNECFRRKGRAWILCPSFDSQKSGVQEKVFEYLKEEDIVRATFLAGKICKEVELSNGTILEFKTYEQGRAKLQSARLISAWFDEEPPEDIYDEVYTRTVDMAGQVILTFTPLLGLSWSYERIFNSPNEHIKVWAWGMYDNPFIPMEEINRLLKELTPRMAKTRIYGEYQGAENIVFNEFDREHNVKDWYDPELPVDVCIDWGVKIAAIGFFQTQIVREKEKTYERYVLIDAMELHQGGYGQIMMGALKRGYVIKNWYCDPAGSSRSQATKSGRSLLSIIKEEYGIAFRYIKRLGIEESVDLVNAQFCSASGHRNFFIRPNIELDKKGGTVENRIENYARSDETNKPIDDDFNVHLCDVFRYYISNKLRSTQSITQK